MRDLPLQITQLHFIAVDQHQCANTGRCQVQRSRTPETTEADHQHAGLLQPLLPRDVKIVQQNLSVVARKLRVSQHASNPR